ncbi:UNVERIFIED_CONTAM: hypothetical protein FKN15_032104 [Acipenser sinensis]
MERQEPVGRGSPQVRIAQLEIEEAVPCEGPPDWLPEVVALLRVVATQSSGVSPQPPLLCWRCGQPGHWHAECPGGRRAVNTSNQRQETPRGPLNWGKVDPAKKPCNSGAGSLGDGGRKDHRGRPLPRHGLCGGSDLDRLGGYRFDSNHRVVRHLEKASRETVADGGNHCLGTDCDGGADAEGGKRNSELLKHPVWIAPVQDSCILGMDFLRRIRAQVDLWAGVLHLSGGPALSLAGPRTLGPSADGAQPPKRPPPNSSTAADPCSGSGGVQQEEAAAPTIAPKKGYPNFSPSTGAASCRIPVTGFRHH